MADKDIKTGIEKRFGIVYLFATLFALCIVGRIVWLNVWQHDKWIARINESQKEVAIEPNRGDICASDGVNILATSIPYYDVRLDTKAVNSDVFVKNLDSLSLRLSRLFKDKSAYEYKTALVAARNRGDRYYLVHRRANYVELKELKTFPLFRLGQYKGGVIYVKENRRVRPYESLAARTIGYEGRGGIKVGIEGAYDKELSGEKGYFIGQRIPGGYYVPINDDEQVDPKDGYDVITTIDINIQDVAHSALENQLKKHGAKYGTAILMEVATGDIKAIVNLTKDDVSGKYMESYNYAVGTRTEPGSTMKLPSLMAGLEDGYFDLDDSVDTGNGKWKVYDLTISDTKKEGHGKISVKHVFEVSSNIGVAKLITESYGKDPMKFVNRLRNMSLTAPLELDIQGGRDGYVKDPTDKLWSGVSLAQMAYGYETEFTPLNILTFYNAVANNGKMMRPRFVKKIVNHGQTVRTIPTEVINPSICSRETIRKAQEMLCGVVENGTAKNMRNSNYKIAGKTGTAQLNQNGTYRYQGRVAYQASFCGYFPADDPKYSCIVVVNAPTSGVYTGNWAAGPVFKEIADKVYSTQLNLHKDKQMIPLAEAKDLVPVSKSGYYIETKYVTDKLDIPIEFAGAKSEWVSTTKTDSTIKISSRTITQNTVPYVIGMGAKDAIFILENAGMSVSIVGRGMVTQQSLQAGDVFRKGDKIILTLS
ncbi:MAG: transpeptidase family protein [Salinivirgaceae bacterium]|nr:transpeptidase family protein [Salinivirgaceae bacterium]